MFGGVVLFVDWQRPVIRLELDEVRYFRQSRKHCPNPIALVVARTQPPPYLKE